MAKVRTSNTTDKKTPTNKRICKKIVARCVRVPLIPAFRIIMKKDL
jgi:hypothetical protein